MISWIKIAFKKTAQIIWKSKNIWDLWPWAAGPLATLTRGPHSAPPPRATLKKKLQHISMKETLSISIDIRNNAMTEVKIWLGAWVLAVERGINMNIPRTIFSIFPGLYSQYSQDYILNIPRTLFFPTNIKLQHLMRGPQALPDLATRTSWFCHAGGGLLFFPVCFFNSSLNAKLFTAITTRLRLRYPLFRFPAINSFRKSCL